MENWGTSVRREVPIPLQVRVGCLEVTRLSSLVFLLLKATWPFWFPCDHQVYPSILRITTPHWSKNMRWRANPGGIQYPSYFLCFFHFVGFSVEEEKMNGGIFHFISDIYLLDHSSYFDSLVKIWLIFTQGYLNTILGSTCFLFNKQIQNIYWLLALKTK